MAVVDAMNGAPPSGDTPPEHGGDLAAAMQRYDRAGDWLDLSTGINPTPYPVPSIPPLYFQRLPAADTALLRAARDYYCGAVAIGADAVVAAPGSQALIQALPLLRAHSRVAVPACGYREHAFRWRRAGHELVEYDPRAPAAVTALLRRDAIDVVVAINPNNPLGCVTPRAQLLEWLQILQARGGWLVVDEAFADPLPGHSIAAGAPQPGLIALRSLGKFFGLAGLRCGFALCAPELAAALRVALGPWPLSGPAVDVAERALRDTAWQQAARIRLQAASTACAQLLEQTFEHRAAIARTALFVSVQMPAVRAAQVQEQLASRGIWVRRLPLNAADQLLRFGLVDPDTPPWRRLQAALREIAAGGI
jgi:cobalamin biosynthetic protein CobC